MLETKDLLVLVAAALALVLPALWVARRVRSADAFLTAGRRFPGWVVALSLGVTAASAALLAGGVAGVSGAGLGALRPLLVGWLWLPVLVFVWAPILQRNRLTTAPEYLGLRFSAGVRRAAAVVSVVLLVGLLAAELAAFGATLRALTGSPALLWAAAAAVVVTTYAAWGGQPSVVISDVVAAGLLAIGLVVLVVLGLGLVELPALWRSTPVSLRSLVPEPLTGGPTRTLAGLTADTALVSVAALLGSQAVTGRLVTGRGERSAGRGALLGLGPLVLAVAACVAFGGLVVGWLVDMGRVPAGESADNVLASLIGALGAGGWLGVLAAALLVAVLSTASALLTGVGAVVAVDLDRATEPPLRSARRLRVARLSAALAAAIALALAPLLDWIGGLGVLASLIGAVLGGPLGLVLLGGMLSRRLGRRTALVALLAGVAAGVIPLAFASGPRPDARDLVHCALAALGATLAVLFVGRVLAWRTTPPVWLNLTWRNLAPLWEARRAEIELRAAGEPPADPDALPEVRLPKALLEELGLKPGHQVHLTRSRGSRLGLRSFRAVVSKTSAGGKSAEAPAATLADAGLVAGDAVTVERVA